MIHRIVSVTALVGLMLMLGVGLMLDGAAEAKAYDNCFAQQVWYGALAYCHELAPRGVVRAEVKCGPDAHWVYGPWTAEGKFAVADCRPQEVVYGSGRFRTSIQ